MKPKGRIRTVLR